MPEPEPIPTMPVITDEPAGDWPLFVPGSDDPYSYHQDADGWVDAFLTLMDKIMQSKKSKGDEKLFKIGEFERVNRGFFSKVRDTNEGLYTVLTTGICGARFTINQEAQAKK